MDKITTETIEIICEKLPPTVDFLENEIISKKGQGFEILRYSIVEVRGNVLILSVSGRKI